jgi:hypothetical protein
MLKHLLAVCLLGLTAITLHADCIYNGVAYPEGTVIGPYICKEGKWVVK